MIKTLVFSMPTILALSFFSVSYASTGSTLVFGMDVRLRYEFQDNFNQKYYGDDPKQGSADYGFLLGRFRTGFDWCPCKKLHLAFWGQHSEVWGMALPDSAFYHARLRPESKPV